MEKIILFFILSGFTVSFLRATGEGDNNESKTEEDSWKNWKSKHRKEYQPSQENKRL